MNQIFNLMRYSRKLILLTIIFYGIVSVAVAKDIYVSPKGNDSNPGTKQLPLVTIERARNVAYDALENGTEKKVTVWLAGAVYSISNPINFKPLSTQNKKVVLEFKALPGENPAISGGIKLTGWKKNSLGFWETNLPNSFNSERNPRELFINQRRATRARFPNKDYLHVKKVGDDRRTNFFFGEGDFPIPGEVEGVELVLLHDWSISRIGIKDIDVKENKLIAVDSIGAKNPDFFNLDNWEPNPRYFLENAPEFLDEDYEWVSVPKENKILLKLPESENPANLEIVVPFSEGLIFMNGTENQPVENIHFEGITFRNSAWEIPELGYCGVQACHFDPRPPVLGWSVVPAAIKADWAQNCSFSGCTFENLGGSGVWLGTGWKNCSIEDSHFSDISGNGIMIGEGRDREVNGEKWYKAAPEQVALGNSIKNSAVTDCGKQFFGAVGIWCGLTAVTTIKNNQIYNLPYSGISIGWMWSPEPTPCRENLIEGNHIHHIMQILSDGGGIYMLGLQPGSKILKNDIHDVKINAGRAESNGMFLDEGTTDVVIANNLIYNIAKSPLRFHRATTNLVKDNYLFCQNGNPPIRYNTTKEEDIKKVDNKVYNEGDVDYNEALKKAIRKWE
jgi:hypothetical protein